jgi:Ca2+-binding EF-hand superfamily protein
MSRVPNEKDMKLYREAFNLFDTDGNGAIDVDELRGILQALDEELPLSDIERMVNNIGIY